LVRSWFIFCLALMVVLLGASAKRSQYDSPSQHAHYLAKAVKMVSQDADDAAPAVAPATEADSGHMPVIAAAPMPAAHWQALLPALVSTPLVV
jgi:hypothetical protein